MKTLGIYCSSTFAVGLFMLFGCVRNSPPFDLSPQPVQPINGQITVTALSGITPTGGVSVEVIPPFGLSQIKTTNATAAQGIVGQASFFVSTTGVYKVRLANQPAATPFFSTVELSADQPYTTVPLQLNGVSLVIAPTDGKSQSYTAGTDVHAYSLTYNNVGSFNSDLTLVTTGLPAGWTISMPNASVQSGQSVPFYIYNAPGSMANPAIISLNGYAGSNLVASASVSLTKNWAFGLNLGQLQNYRGINSECASNSAYRVTSMVTAQFASVNVDAATLASVNITGTFTITSVSFQSGCVTQTIVLPATGNLGDTLTMGTMRDGGGASFTIIGTFTLYANGNLVAYNRPFTKTSSGPNYNWNYQSFY